MEKQNQNNETNSDWCSNKGVKRMIYEPENLKNKKALYEKRDKWLIRLAFLF